MVMEIRIYAEGGGDSKDTKAFFRQGLSAFLGDPKQSAHARRIRWTVVVCGPRQRAFVDFRNAIASHPDSFNILLVDSEAIVEGTPWQHLKLRDGWNAPEIPDDHCQLMVQAMEAWFVADPEGLASFYGRDFNGNSIPRTNVESVGKHQLNQALRDATRNTQKGEYHKIRHGCKLLEIIDPVSVRQALSHCARLFATLYSLIDG